MESIISGLIIGSRKCGTTWVYENFRLDTGIKVSDKVKESGFFAKSHISKSDRDRYLALIDRSQNDDVISVEVDASIAHYPNFATNINRLAPDAAVVLILRKPDDYLVSRLIHSIRKGEVKSGSLEIMLGQNKWLLDEIDYKAIVSQFESLRTEHKLLIPFELLEADDIKFYSRIKSCILKLQNIEEFTPPLRKKVNVARASQAGNLTILITDAAKFLRRAGFHGLVNYIKNLGVHNMIEKEIDKKDFSELTAEVEEYIHTNSNTSMQIWNNLAKRYLQK